MSVEKWHFTPDLVARLIEGEGSSIDYASHLLRHLLTDCPVCRQAWMEGLEWLEASMPDTLALPEEVDARALDGRLASWRLKELLALPAEERWQRVDGDPDRYGHPELARLLVEEARRLLPGDARASGELARLARRVVSRREWGLAAFPVYIRATAYLANSERCAGRLEAADERWVEIHFLLQAAPVERRLRAELCCLEASLRRAQRRLSEAVLLLQRSVTAYRQLGDKVAEARVLLKLSTVHEAAGAYDEGVEVARRVIEESADLTEAEELVALAWHNILDQLTKGERYEEAAQIYQRAAVIYDCGTGPWWRIRRQAIQARLALGKGDWRTADERLRMARDGFVAEGQPFDAALVDLERADLLLDRGCWPEVQELAGAMVCTFRQLGVHREAQAAALLFAEAARQQQITHASLSRLGTFLQASRHDPALAFAGF